MQGRRIPDDEFFDRRSAGTLAPGDYGVMVNDETGQRHWLVRCPDGFETQLWVNEDDSKGNRHLIHEHDDDTVTVEGSILGRTFHGHLRRGVWVPC